MDDRINSFLAVNALKSWFINYVANLNDTLQFGYFPFGYIF